LGAVIAVPLAAAVVVGVELLATSPDLALSIDDDSTSTEVVDYLILLCGLTLVSLGPWIAAVLAYPFVSARARGEQLSFLDSVRYSLASWWPLTVASVLSGLAVLAATFACIAPGVFLAVLWVVWLPALLDEDLRGRAALGRSAQLVKGRWWQTCGRYIVGALIAGVASAFITRIGFTVATTVMDSESTAAMIVYFAAATLGAIITTPLIVCLLAVIYIDLRARMGEPVTPVSRERFHGFAPPTAGA
jgi:hypothetical protein